MCIKFSSGFPKEIFEVDILFLFCNFSPIYDCAT